MSLIDRRYRITKNRNGWRRIEYKAWPWVPWWVVVGGPYKPGGPEDSVIDKVVRERIDAQGKYTA